MPKKPMPKPTPKKTWQDTKLPPKSGSTMKKSCSCGKKPCVCRG
jgi:hypothetical protein